MKRRARVTSNDKTAAPRCRRNGNVSDKNCIFREELFNRIQDTLPWSHRISHFLAQCTPQLGHSFSIGRFRRRLLGTDQINEAYKNRFSVTDYSDGMWKIAVDGPGIRIDADVLRGRLQAPVRCFVSTKSHADADQQVRLCYEVLQSRKRCKVSEAACIGLGNDSASGLSGHDRGIQ